MTLPQSHGSLIALLLGGALAACSGAPDVGAPEATARDDGRFSTALAGAPVHEDITAAGLDFLRPEIISAIQGANVSIDVAFALDNAHHFDDCNFTGGVGVIRAYQAAAVAALDPASPPVTGDAAAVLAFGSWLHTAQDFYAHSNWVELGGSGIVESSLTTWPAWQAYEALPGSGFVLVDGTPPKSTSVTRPSDAPYPQDAVVRVKTHKRASPGLITGSVDYEPGDSCPPSVEMTHADLNKDHSTTPGRESQFVTAKSAAIAQTRHEWCRLAAMVHAAWGEAGDVRLSTWVADPTRATCDVARTP